MTTQSMQDQMRKISQFADHATRMMIVKVTAVDLTNGDCTVDAQDGGGTITDVPFFGNDPAVGDLCLAWLFDGMIAVMGNAGLKNSISSSSTVLTAASGWSVSTSNIFYGREVATFYFNVSRTGAAIASNSTGNITNVVIGTVKAGSPLPIQIMGCSQIGGSLAVVAALVTDGTLNLAMLPPNLPFNTGYSFNATVTYPYA